MNVGSSVGIVMLNKFLYQEFGFKYVATLTAFHFIVTFIGLQVLVWAGVFTPKKLPISRVLTLCVAFCGNIVLSNLSLRLNSVGFYQMMKIMNLPVVVSLQIFVYKKWFSWKTKAALAMVCTGVAISTVSDVDLNLVGVVVAASATLAASLYQVWIGRRQQELNVTSFQLLYYQAPLSAAMLLLVVPLVDDVGALLTTTWTPNLLGVICATGAAAFGVNYSVFLVIGRTSPTTYNVVGHFKTTMVLAGGFLFFGDSLTARSFLGVVITLTGVIQYTQLKMAEQSAAAAHKTDNDKAPGDVRGMARPAAEEGQNGGGGGFRSKTHIEKEEGWKSAFTSATGVYLEKVAVGKAS